MLCDAFEEHSLSQTAVFKWHPCFKRVSVSVEDDECSGLPSANKTTENVERIIEPIHKDHHQTIHELAGATGISYGVCQEILTKDLDMHHIASEFVP
jgi:hypothetical protein